ncbi:cysteine desulfurase-like protein [Brevibacillus fluminis]|uniref:Cysteine desulfurase-like protein n=1 Tax=Brevibacillus fluminis TaxID=511487 RepID=A0A3M8DD01_9BACL|nr:cysteine desulfurase-like protein [Brevibacillus fluminis]RNB85461.1 cysteine desulfurase-like protein [Brevibacillus fluminis]
MRNLSDCRQEFPSLKREVNGYPVAYLDGPGGTQVPSSVIAAVSRYYETSNANIHGCFTASRETDQLIEQTREAVAVFLGASDASQISFGQNMTTLNFALARAIGRTIQPGDEVIVTDLDHDANVAPWLTLAERGAVIHHVPIREDSTLDMERFYSLLSERTKVVAVGYASNAVGTVNDVYKIRQWTREIGATLVIDAVHFAAHGLIDVEQLDPDFLLCSAYKWFGPHIGILYSSKGALDRLTTDKVRPQVNTSPEKIETGTLNHAALAGVKAAVEFIASLANNSGGSLRENIVRAMLDMYVYEHSLAGQLYRGLKEIPGVTIYGTPVGEGLRTPTVSFTMNGLTPSEIAERLGELGIYVWDGDFYAISVIKKFGLADSGGLVRIGFAPYNTEEEISRLLTAVEGMAKKNLHR